ncbi:MAG: hypothetical protein EZS28_015152 [Streblomastix strix]|uniref:Uncharacterized protein n=1 Tax=Streblomastix strix TaxID=222440 RepID=A0A5J4W314_9EUKA|nr:MAG: hypothetical protein EZS28_015152 [Streblomastix strix]
MPHLPLHKSYIETAQRTWQNRENDQVKDISVIKYKNSKWHSKLATQKPFIFRDWTDLKAPTISQGEVNLLDQMKGRKKMQQRMQTEQRGRDLTRRSWMQKRKRNKSVVVAAVAVAVTANKYKKIGHGKKILQPYEPMKTMTGPRMMNAKDKQIKRYKSNLEKMQQAKNQQQFQPQKAQMQKDPETLITQVHNTIHPANFLHHPLKSTHHHPHQKKHQLYYEQFPLETPRGYKDKEHKQKLSKLQQYARLMDVVKSFHEITKLIIEEEQKKPKVILPGQYERYLKKMDLNLSEDQWNQIDWDVREGVFLFYLLLTNNLEAWANLPK